MISYKNIKISILLICNYYINSLKDCHKSKDTTILTKSSQANISQRWQDIWFNPNARYEDFG